MSVHGAIESKRRLSSCGVGASPAIPVFFVLTLLRENIGLSVWQFVQFWPIVLFFRVSDSDL